MPRNKLSSSLVTTGLSNTKLSNDRSSSDLPFAIALNTWSKSKSCVALHVMALLEQMHGDISSGLSGHRPEATISILNTSAIIAVQVYRLIDTDSKYYMTIII